jgi:molecular chaperone DnaK (HSP70)
VRIRVMNGEYAMAKDNRLLGEFELRDIGPAPAGEQPLEVVVEVDVSCPVVLKSATCVWPFQLTLEQANGLIFVKAIEKGNRGNTPI